MPDKFQLQALIIALSKFGLGAVLALFLVWKLTDAFEDQLKAHTTRLANVEKKLDDHAAVMERDAIERKNDARLQRLLMRGICLGTSGDIPQARALCNLQE